MNAHKSDLLYSKDLAENLLELMPEGMILLNSKNCIEFTNEAVLKVLGFTVDQISGKHISEIYQHRDEGHHFIAMLDENVRVRNKEDRFITSEKRVFLGSYSGILIPGQEDSETIKLILLRDLTDHQNIEERLASANRDLEKNNKELDQFAYIVSHDLKAPLRAISNLSLWLQEDLGASLSGENKTNFDLLRGRVVRLESLINGILEYSKLGREKIHTERIDVFKLVEEVVEMVGCPAHIRIDLEEEMPFMDASRVMLIQVFSNLVSNAIKHNDKKEGLIRIYSSEGPNEYQITIEDNGPGIPEEFREKIFVIFQTLQSRDKFENTGIGLAIVKRIVEEHRGRICVESEVGKGSKFIFTWPKQGIDQHKKSSGS